MPICMSSSQVVGRLIVRGTAGTLRERLEVSGSISQCSANRRCFVEKVKLIIWAIYDLQSILLPKKYDLQPEFETKNHNLQTSAI